MPTVTMREAKNKLTELARRVESGETIIVTRNGKPVMELVAPKKAGGIRWEGIEEFKKEHGIKSMKGWISPDFDEPLPDDFLSTPLTYPATPGRSKKRK